MMSPLIHRKWAREYLARAQHARSRSGKLELLRRAVSNSVRAQSLETESALDPLDRRFMRDDGH
jgi:hypothetical protein